MEPGCEDIVRPTRGPPRPWYESRVMFVETRVTWLSMILLGGVALPNILFRTALVTVLSIGVTAAYLFVPAVHYSLTTAPFVMTGLPLGIFLGFRNSAAYDRFWEGRKLWGALVNTSRSFTRQVLTFVRSEDAPAEVSSFATTQVHLLIGFAHALRHHLRDTDPWPTLRPIIGDDEVARLEGEPNVPVAIVQRMGNLFAEARAKGWIHDFHLPVLEGSLVSFTDIQGACERIKSTPIPYSYTVLMHRIVGVYCVLLPFGVTDTIGWGTPLVVLFISYALFGLDAVGAEIEQPFGMEANDLALNAIANTIERNARVRIGEPSPPPTEPVDSILH